MTDAGLQGSTKRCLIMVAIAFGLVASFWIAALAGPAVPTASAQGEGKRILLYTGTMGFRHGGAIDQGTPVVQGALEDMGFEVDWEDCDGNACRDPENNPAIFTESNLANYDAIFFLNASDYWSGTGGTPGQLFNASEEAAIIDYVQNGGGIGANHNATDAGAGQETWDWWDGDENSVVGTTMAGHADTDLGNQAEAEVADRNHLSTRDLPDTYDFGGEHYNWNRNVRGTHHVLATFDETTYDPGGNGMGQDHPISWCKTYDGDNVEDGTGDPKQYSDGRSWITGMGHFGSQYTENGGDNELVSHIAGGIRWLAGEGLKSDCTGTVWSSFQRTTLVDTASDGPIAIDVAEDGKVYWTEIGYPPGLNSEGYVMMHDQNGPAGNKTIVATIPTRADHGNSEDGVLGMSLEPGFDISDPESRDIYVYYSPRGEGEDWPTTGNEIAVGYNLISRFTLNADGTAFEPDSEQRILEVDKAKISGSPFGDNGPGHVGGASLVFDAEGNLVLGVGDDVSPNADGHNRFAPMDHRRPERWDARKTSANTADLRGKVLRIDPIDGASGVEPGEGQTYEIPGTNLFAGDGDPQTRGEIFAMGFRQPFTVHADPENPDTVVVGEYCHDARPEQIDRSPDGTCEWNLIDEPAFHGWPFCVGDNSADDPMNTMTRWDYTTGTSTGDKYDCSLSSLPADLRYDPPGGDDDSSEPTNDGLDEIPGPAAPATIWKDYDGDYPQEVFGNLNAGGNQPITGPIFRSSPTAGQGAFPAYYDGSWLIANRGSDGGFWKEVRLRSDDNEMLNVHDFMPDNQFGGPRHSQVIGTRFGPDGALYMARFPVGCCRNNGTSDVEILKIESSVVDECLEDEFAPNVSSNVTGQPHPTADDTWVGNYEPAVVDITANDVGCAGVDTVEYRVDGGEWQEFTDPIEFTDAGTYEVEYRATDSFDPPNTSDIGSTTFTVEVVDDQTPPEVSAEVSGPQNTEGDYNGRANIEVAASDEISPIETIEYSTDGGANWTTETYEDGQYDDGFSELLEAELTDPGDYTVAYRATDAAGNTSDEGALEFTIAEVEGCTPMHSDDFESGELDTSKWTVVREDSERLSVSDGSLNIVSAPDDIFAGQGTTMPNIVLQEIPGGGEEPWSISTEMTWAPTQNYQNAGLVVYGDDANYIKTGMVWAGGRGFEAFKELNDSPTNIGNANVPAGLGDTFHLRLVSQNGDDVQAQWSEDGEAWTNISSVSDLSGISNPRIGVYATASTEDGVSEPTASFHSIDLEPDDVVCPQDCLLSDEFDSGVLSEKWNVRVDEPGEVSFDGGHLVLPTLNEVDGTATGPLAFVSQQVPEGDWSLTTRVTPDLNSSWAQAGIMLWQSDGNFVKYVFGRDSGNGERRIEMASDDPIDQRNTGDNSVVDMSTETVWLRLYREGDTIYGEWALDEDGEPGEWTQPAIQTRPVDTDPPREGEGVQLGLYAGADIEGPPFEQVARFDFARFQPDDNPECPGGGDDTTPPVTDHSLDPEDPGEGGTYEGPVDVTLSATDPDESGGGGEPANHDVDANGTVWEPDELSVEFGDQVTWNFPSETAGFPHDVWLIAPGEPLDSEGVEITDGVVNPGGPSVDYTFEESGTWTYICKVHSFIQNGQWQGMVGTAEVGEDAGGGTPGSGVDFTEYRVNTDGATGDWQQSSNTGDADPFETTFTIDEPGDHVVEYRSTDNAGNEEEIKSFEVSVADDGGPGPCPTDEFDGDSINDDLWQRHTRSGGTPTEGELAPQVEGGQLIMPTNDLELDGASATTAAGPTNFLGQDITRLGENWEVETQFTIEHTGGWQHAGLIVWQGDNNFFRSTITNHLSAVERTIYVEQSKDEPTSAEGDRITAGGNVNIQVGGTPQPITIKMRYAREAGSDSLVSQYEIVAPESLATGDWVDFPATSGGWNDTGGLNLAPEGGPRRDSAGSRIGLISGGNFPDSTGNNQYEGVPAEMAVDYFRVTSDDVECPVDNTPPVIDSIAADPDTGDAPLEVDFTAEASDGDGDELTYSWDFGDGDTSDEQNPTHTYAEPGTYDAELTVSDGIDEVSDSVTVQVNGGGDDDVTPPETEHLLVPTQPGDGGTYETPVTIALFATDSGPNASGVDTTELRATVDGETGDWTEYNPFDPPTFEDNGSYTVEYRSTDVAENVEEPKSVSFEIDMFTAAPELMLQARPESRTVPKKRKQVRYRARATNVGAESTGDVQICVRAPSKRLRVRGPNCRDIGALEPTESALEMFQFRIKRAARGKLTRIRFIGRGPDIDRAKAVASLRVRG